MESVLYAGKLLLIAFAGIIATAAVYVVAKLIMHVIRTRPRRPHENGFEFVFVNDDGSARELDDDEIEYLSTDFHPADGGRPYIKLDYEDRTPDGMLHGYLRRRQLPVRVSITPRRTE